MQYFFLTIALILIISTIYVGIREHNNRCGCKERDVFCTGLHAFVKCLQCGAESIPWEVQRATGAAWVESNPDWAKRLVEIDKRAKEFWSTKK